MTATVDVNILVYATDETSARYRRARALVEHISTSATITYLFWPVLVGYLRIVTHPAITESPLRPADALANVDALLSRPQVRTAGEGEAFWASFKHLATSVSPRGNLVSDMHLAALMRQHEVTTIWTNDRDFRKFDGITARDPFGERYSNGFG